MDVRYPDQMCSALGTRKKLRSCVHRMGGIHSKLRLVVA